MIDMDTIEEAEEIAAPPAAGRQPRFVGSAATNSCSRGSRHGGRRLRVQLVEGGWDPTTHHHS